ncbi:MAG: DUF177 domain-containing protein [Deltaproteobacteria bacterium]|nr:DUF177 domain-containing protein [Deltaproteobacteria bacterium]MBW2049376.1 DUF177 domain-containing protein [Deltaproteobacteria bacterium]MBW2110583.1 DUF177 domain-containing protein [Deltaproteobacteria bacterium]HDZ89944.1 DUF177 domain-containing protein [Deltaproteobacteria bacterium]
MLVRIKDLSSGPREFDLTLDQGWWRNADWDDRILGLEGTLRVRMRLYRDGENLVVQGRLSGGIRVRCDRCLSEYFHELKPGFRLFLSPPPEDVNENEIELCEEDMGIRFFTGDTCDTDEIIREQILLTLPIKTLCAEGCQGLCPRCGANLNMGRCGCREENGHPAFLKLKQLKVGST